MQVILRGTSPYLAKDQRKSNMANKFIGYGCRNSSTESYRISWGDKANCGGYVSTDIVFISVNGARPGGIDPPYAEIAQAIEAGATLITDIPSDRNRTFNIGERNVAGFLNSAGYVERTPGSWTPE